MKIALVIDRFLPYKGGGERYIEILASNLVKRGHAVTIFSRRFPDKPSRDISIQYHRILAPAWPGFLRVLYFARLCKKAVGNDSFDIIHDVGHIIGADIFNPHGGVEQVWLERYFESYSNPAIRFLKKIERILSPKEWSVIIMQKRQYLSKETHRIIAISPMIKAHIQTFYPEIPDHKISLIQNPAELSRFTPENRKIFRDVQRKELGLKPSDIAILFAGNNFRLKGLHPLIRSLKVLEHICAKDISFRLLVVGNETPTTWEKFCEKIGVAKFVTFLGPTGEMEKYYAASDIFVLPTYYDSSSLVVLEALASGLPVITSSWNGASALIDVPAAGMVLDKNDDPEEIASALFAFFPIKKRREALEASPKMVATLGVDYHVEQILKIYQEVIKEKVRG